MNMNIILRMALVLILSVFLNACVDEKSSTGTSDVKSNSEQVVEKLIIAINTRDTGELEKLVTDDFVNHSAMGKGPAAMMQTVAQITEAFPDLRIESELMVSEDDLVTVLLTGRGSHRGLYLGAPPTGRRAMLISSHIFRVRNGKIAEQWTIADKFGLLQQLTGPYPQADPAQYLPVEILASFQPPVFLESILVNDDGTMFVTDLFGAKIYRISKTGETELFFETDVGRTPMYRGVICITPEENDQLFVTINAEDPQQHGVWFVDNEGNGKPFSILPHNTLVNGITRHPGGDLLVADSSQGKIWRINTANGAYAPWIEHDLLSPRLYIGQFPGANGIQASTDSIYVSNSDKALILRIPVRADGSAGQPEVIVNDLGSDDFAVAEDGTLYVATHVLNTVVRVTPGGARRIIASPENGLIGPTAAFLHNEGSNKYLYVVTDGGMTSALSPVPDELPVPVPDQKPVVARIKL